MFASKVLPSQDDTAKDAVVEMNFASEFSMTLLEESKVPRK